MSYPQPFPLLTCQPSLCGFHLGFTIASAVIYAPTPLAVLVGWIVNFHQPSVFWSLFAGISAASSIALTLTIVLSIGHTARRDRDPVERTQFHWIVFGFVAGLGTTVTAYTLQHRVLGPSPVVAALGFAGLPIFYLSLVVAILRYRLFAIEVIINRTLVYGSVSAILAGVFAGISLVVQHVVLALTGKESQIDAVIAAVVVTALFQPVRHRAQSLVDHYLHPARFATPSVEPAAAEAQSAVYDTLLE